MNKIGFRLVKFWTGFMSVQPYWMLYLKSDFYCFLVYHIFRYRRKVVRQNLLRSFPMENEREIKAIEKRFYHNFCDLVVEVPKMLRPGHKGFIDRITYTNPELVKALFDQHRNVLYAFPHSGNWEWFANTMHKLAPHKCLAIYKKVKNPAFDQLMFDLRTNDSALELVESKSAIQQLTQLQDSQNALLMVADQSSHGLDSDHWTEFLHQDTCWFTGMERIAKMLDYAVVFVAMKRQGRGRYEVTFKLITDNPKETGKGFIIEQYVRCVERFIEEQPDNWLWSHRRWKHQRNQTVE